MRSKLVVGMEPWLSLAMESWEECDSSLQLLRHELSIDQEHKFDFSFLENIDSTSTTGFVAWGSAFLNFQRAEIMGELKKKGFKMPPLISPSALVSKSVRVMENAWIQSRATIEPQAVVGFNAVICSGARVGVSSIISKNVWIGDDARIGPMVKIGSNVTLGSCVRVNDGVVVGRQAYIEPPTVIGSNWPDNGFRFISRSMEGVIVDLS